MAEITEDILTKVIKKRPSDSHKGNYGRILLIGGSENYGGAIIMAAEAALNSGTGLISVATHAVNLDALHARNPEVMFIDWRDRNLVNLMKKMDVIVCGPGLGTGTFAWQLMSTICQNVSQNQILVLDASALDMIAQDKNLIPKQASLVILTPHQMEWQRLSQIRIPFQTDSANLSALKKIFPTQNAILVLKSNHTHIYTKTDQIFVNPLGNPGMATGGMGDTLAGIIGGFTAQFGNNLDSVLAAVFIHSLAGDKIAENNYVVRPTTISALLPQLMEEYAS
ncbi:NAD(P)H-hydrate dehydratase [Lactobacillus laiwuensis]|uniref:NAD(P)H-hydrate dehydratase n=1 Tax=Lactobacillus laiwuensis TaxID=2841034 RepID=UPI001CC461F7|nr:NAD(P)H-hydrate dehydratase [Lactobacillus laiwuensis]